MTTHLDLEIMAIVKHQILEQRATGSWWSTWEAVAQSVQQFLDTGAFDRPEEPLHLSPLPPRASPQ